MDHRLRLLPFPALAAIMGLGYLFGDPVRTAPASFNAAKSLAPMEVWGVVFLLGTAALLAAIALGNRLTALALYVGGTIYTWWAVGLAVSALTDPAASANAWAAYGFIAAVHYSAASTLWVNR